MNKIFTLLIITLIITTNSAFAQEQTPDTFSHKLGKFEIILLSEGQRTGSSDILIGATPQMLYECIPSGSFPNATNAFLIKTPDSNILVDTGYGTKLFSNLKSLGISPEQIDIILITHMHGDHIGGLLQNNKVMFPKSKIYIPQPEYDYWMDDKAMLELPESKQGGFLNARKIIAAYKDSISLFQPNMINKQLYSLLPGISAIAAYGHTPGHTVYLVESDDDQIMIWGDITHAMAIQIPYPSVAVTYDIDFKQAIISRKNILDFVSRNNNLIAGMHIAFPAIGIISTISSGGYVFYQIEN